MTWEDFRAPLTGEWNLGKGQILLPKLDLENLEQEMADRKEQKVEKTAEKKEEKKDEGPKYIGYEDWTKINIIAVKVLAAEAVDGADKLLRLTVDDGKRQDRTIVSGIRKDYTPEDMTGRTIFHYRQPQTAKDFRNSLGGDAGSRRRSGRPHHSDSAPTSDLAPGTPVG